MSDKTKAESEKPEIEPSEGDSKGGGDRANRLQSLNIPYIYSPGTVDNVLKRMKEAATPPRVTPDFVSAVLQLKGGTGASIPPFLKKLGFVNSDGSPTALYDRYRNDATSKAAVAEAMRIGFKPLFKANEYAFRLSDNDLRGLIVQVTGLEKDNRVAQAIHATWKRLAANADFEAAASSPEGQGNRHIDEGNEPTTEKLKSGLKLSYTINLNLPATSNPEVFAAIFKSLKEHLLND